MKVVSSRQATVRFEEGAGARPGDFVLGEIRDLDGADRLADRLDLGRHVVVGPGALEGRLLVGVLGAVGEPERGLQAEGVAHDRAPRHQPVVERRGLLAAALGQGLVGEGQDEAALVVLRGLDRAVFGRRVVAEAGHVHGPDVDRGLAVHHPLGETEADAAGLAEAGHDADRDPVVPEPRHRADHGVAVGAEGEGAVDHVLDAGPAERRDPLEAQFEPVGDAVEVGRQQLVAEVHGRAGHLPGRRARLVGPQQHALAFLPEVHVALVVDAGGQTHVRPPLDDLRDRLGDQVVVLHGLHGQLQAGHVPDLAGPEAAGVDHHLGVDRAGLGHHVPGAVRPLVGLEDGRVGVIGGAVVARRLGVGVGDAGGIDVAVERVPEGGDIAAGVDQRMAPLNLLERDELLVEAHVTGLGALALQIVVPVLGRGEVEAAGRMHADRLARGLLDLLVEIDGVALEARDVGV
jgi:hypothetical protein